jgi:hypothetical protein
MKFSEIFGPDNKSKKDKQSMDKRRKWDAAFCSRVINNLPVWIVGFHKESMKTDGAFRKEMDNFKKTMNQRKAEFKILADKNKIRNIKAQFRFDTDWKKIKKPSAPEDFPFEVLHKHMFSIYLNLHSKLDNEDQEKKLWEYFVSAKHENPLLKMVKDVKQDATASFDDIESFSATGEPPEEPIDGHMLGLLERRGKKQKASGSVTPRPKKKAKQGPGTGPNLYILDQADCSDDDNDNELPSTPSSQGSSGHELENTPPPAYKAMNENRSFDADLNRQQAESEAEEARREAEHLKKTNDGQGCSKDDIIKVFIEAISEKLEDENKVIDDNAKQDLQNLIQEWLNKIPGRMVQGSMDEFVKRRVEHDAPKQSSVGTSTVLTLLEDDKEVTSTSASEPAKRVALKAMDPNELNASQGTKRKDSTKKGAASTDSNPTKEQSKKERLIQKQLDFLKDR